MPFYARTKIHSLGKKLPDESHFILLISKQNFESLKSRFQYRILDRSLYYKRSDSRVWQILNIAKGYRENRPDRTGELLLVEVLGKR